MKRRRFLVMGLCDMLAAASLSLARDEPTGESGGAHTAASSTLMVSGAKADH